ncbi:MAG TPA: hypothetical protein EYO33_18755 [Phycisphaerales bacterium]|nr:hypothetical protein [Phycisphaerales bacterium]
MTEAELQSLLACLNEPVLVLDEVGQVLSMNGLAVRFLGALEGPLVAKPLIGTAEYWLIGPVDGSPLQAEGRECLLQIDGSKGRLLALKRFPFDEGLLQRLKVLEQRYELATSAAQVGIFDRIILTENAPPPYWSASMRQLLGYDEDRPADPDWFWERVEKSDRESLAEAYKTSSNPHQGDGKVKADVRWHHPDGKLRHLWVRSQTLRTTDRTGADQIRSVGVVIDVTEHRA